MDAATAARCSLPSVLVAGVLVTSPAAADLAEDARRVQAAWAADGLTVVTKSPAFLFDGDQHDFEVDVPTGEGCTTVAVIAAPTVDVEVVFSPVPLWKLGEDAEEVVTRRGSRRGAASLSLCGAQRQALKHGSVRLRSTPAAGAVELLIGHGIVPGGPPDDALPERVAGARAPRGDPGRPLQVEPTSVRLAAATARAKRDGASRFAQVAMKAADSGRGRFELTVSPGCHRFELVASSPDDTSQPWDLDAELTVAGEEGQPPRLLDADRSDTPDARLDACVGERQVVWVAYSGASGGAEVTLSDAQWPLPEGIPDQWGARAQAGFASALQRRRVASITQMPVATAMGVQGETSWSVPVESGQCYVAAAAFVRGDGNGLRLRAAVGGHVVGEELPGLPEGVAVSFCAKAERHARFTVGTRGSGPWWAFSMWAVGDSIYGTTLAEAP